MNRHVIRRLPRATPQTHDFRESPTKDELDALERSQRCHAQEPRGIVVMRGGWTLCVESFSGQVAE